MKNKLLYISLFILLVFPFRISASECSQTCEISDAPAPALTEYFTNLTEITSNVTQAISEYESELDEDRPTTNSRSQERNRVMAALNSILSFRDYFWSFEYNIILPITNELPSEVRRDHTRIESQTERLTNLLESTARRSRTHIIVEDVCEGISHCSFWDESVQAVLTAIIQNNQKVGQLYRASVLDKPQLATDRNFILVADDFISQIESHYNKDTLTACSSCEDGFLGTIREKIQDISFKNSDYKEWVQKWRDAWAMLRWWSASWGPDQARREAEAIDSHLSAQWMDTEQADIIIGNQERYDAGGLSSTDPLSNASSQAVAQTQQERKTFDETLAEAERNRQNAIPYLNIIRVDTQTKDEEEISDSIASLYNDQLPYAYVQDTVAQELQSRIIRMHLDLVFTANLLWKQTSKTEKLCNKQATWRGKCEY